MILLLRWSATNDDNSAFVDLLKSKCLHFSVAYLIPHSDFYSLNRNVFI